MSLVIGQLIYKKFNFITLIESGKNIGFAAANNIALSRIKTEYGCFFKS